MLPAILISLLTSPGVIVHEMAHLLCCRCCGAPVYRVCYFRLGHPAGYVIHGAPPRAWQQLVIGIGPVFVNTLVALLIVWPVALRPEQQQTAGIIIRYWLAIAVAMHAFPSPGDARSIWASAWGRGTPLLVKLAAIPLVAVIYLLALGARIGLHLVYGVAVAVYLPRLIADWLR